MLPLVKATSGVSKSKPPAFPLQQGGLRSEEANRELVPGRVRGREPHPFALGQQGQEASPIPALLSQAALLQASVEQNNFLSPLISLIEHSPLCLHISCYSVTHVLYRDTDII